MRTLWNMPVIWKKDRFLSQTDGGSQTECAIVPGNQAESLFSRFKRMYYGQVHRISNEYLLNYANEIAYREDNRRTSNKAQFIDVLSRCLKTTNDNNEWCGYWQRKIIHQEVIWQ